MLSSLNVCIYRSLSLLKFRVLYRRTWGGGNTCRLRHMSRERGESFRVDFVRFHLVWQAWPAGSSLSRQAVLINEPTCISTMLPPAISLPNERPVSTWKATSSMRSCILFASFSSKLPVTGEQRKGWSGSVVCDVQMRAGGSDSFTSFGVGSLFFLPSTHGQYDGWCTDQPHGVQRKKSFGARGLHAPMNQEREDCEASTACLCLTDSLDRANVLLHVLLHLICDNFRVDHPFCFEVGGLRAKAIQVVDCHDCEGKWVNLSAGIHLAMLTSWACMRQEDDGVAASMHTSSSHSPARTDCIISDSDSDSEHFHACKVVHHRMRRCILYLEF